MYPCANCWESNLFSQSLVLIKSLYSFHSVVILLSFAWCPLQHGSESPLPVHLRPAQNCVHPQKDGARPLALAVSYVTRHKHLPWCLEMVSTCRSEITRLENIYFIWCCREAYWEIERSVWILPHQHPLVLSIPSQLRTFFCSRRQLHLDVLDE